jgi:hypothetical protein
MSTLTSTSACCIVGAGYSVVAGLPLTRDLFTSEVIAASQGARRRFQAVFDDFDQWRQRNPARNPEEYLADLYHNLFGRSAPPFAWAVELVAAVLATPRGQDMRAVNPRYGVRITWPSRTTAHVDFWATMIGAFSDVAIATTNYDLLIERSLRHRPMRRAFGPGCHYGGLSRPQILKGASLPFTVRDPQRFVELTGSVPIYKLHGSLNWACTDGELEMYQDMRPAFRHSGDAAIVPPISEKETPNWLQPVWTEAEEQLARADCWIVCGYSMPDYDTAIQSMLRRAAKANLQRMYLLSPSSKSLVERYGRVAPQADIYCLAGLPDGTHQLREALNGLTSTVYR